MEKTSTVAFINSLCTEIKYTRKGGRHIGHNSDVRRDVHSPHVSPFVGDRQAACGFPAPGHPQGRDCDVHLALVALL